MNIVAFLSALDRRCKGDGKFLFWVGKRGDERYVKMIVIEFKKLTVFWQYLFLITMYSMLVVCAPHYHVTDWLIFLTNN